MRYLLILVALLVGQTALTKTVWAKTVVYEFDIAKQILNKTGTPVEGMTVGGGTPGPVIEATEGDVLRVTFHNRMGVQTSIHWHGILLPNEQDGVPILTTSPIAAGASHTFEYPIIQSGTYWYHSHTGLQEQRGVYGAMVLHPKPNTGMSKMGMKMDMSKQHVDKPDEHVVVFSDWSNEDPLHILANLKKDGDYYALKKGSVQSWAGVLANGSEAIKNRLEGSWSRMGPMDISDIGYDAFLANGKTSVDLGEAEGGQTVKLRLVNAAASSYFNVEFSGGPMTIIATDGIDIEPIKVKRLRMAIAETYDVLVSLPMDMAYELRATSEDGTGYASAWIGEGHKMPAPDIPRPNLYLSGHDMMNMDGMDMGGMDHDMDYMDMGEPEMDHGAMGHNMDSMDMSGMERSVDTEKKLARAGISISTLQDQVRAEIAWQQTRNEPMKMGGMKVKSEESGMDVIAHMTGYKAVRSPVDTSLPQTNLRTVNLSLTGNMERYVWSFNNTVLAKADSIKIKKGETVRFVLKNETMMHHPIHLHGHFFRVLNGQGKFSPLKHTVNVPPMETVTIEFAANEEKDWFFHCHNLYHMMGGMARVVSYVNSTNYTDERRSRLAHDKWYAANSHTINHNLAYGTARLSNSDTAVELEYDWNYAGAYDGQVHAKRYLSRFMSVYGGVRTEREGFANRETNGVIGVQYVLPLLIEADLQLATDGHVELEIGSELQLTDRLQVEWEASTDEEYRVGFAYELNKTFALAAGWDSEEGWGIGARLNF